MRKHTSASLSEYLMSVFVIYITGAILGVVVGAIIAGTSITNMHQRAVLELTVDYPVLADEGVTDSASYKALMRRPSENSDWLAGGLILWLLALHALSLLSTEKPLRDLCARS